MSGGGAEKPDLVVRQAEPWNAEPPLERLVRSWITPLELFYVRSHGPVPEVDADEWSLAVEGMVERPLALSLADLESLPQAEVAVTLQCAGNRRSEHSAVRPVGGVAWGAATLGHATWRGPWLMDVLDLAGVRPGATCVEMIGLDRTGDEGVPFGASIPLAKARGKETIVALRMNGGPLPPAHGRPARALVPGYIGARSVKWLERIVVADRPSTNPFQAVDYKVGPPDASMDQVDWPSIPPLQELPLNAVVCDPADGATLPAGRVLVRGYATPPGVPERTVGRVQVSPDGGATWVDATFDSPVRPFAWCLWGAAVDLEPGPAEIVVRAWDSAGALQPPTAPWNARGYVFNGWHRVRVTVA